MRTAREAQGEHLQLLPGGFPFEGSGVGDVDSYVAARLYPLGNELSLVEASMDALLPEVDIRVAYHLLPDYERVLGPDPCGRDISILSFADQAALTYSRWTAGGNICAGYFVRLAASLGTVCTVIECACWECKAATCSDEMITAPENFVVVFRLPTDGVTNFECGPATCDDSLGTYQPSTAECQIRNAVPLHIEPIFSYYEAA